MLDWFSTKLKKKSADDLHPLGSPSAVKEYLVSIPAINPIPCLRAIGEYMEHSHDLAHSLSPSGYRYAVGALDAYAQEPLRRVWGELFVKEGGLADDRWLLLFSYYGYVLDAYQLALSLYPAQGELSGAEREEQALFILRALRTL